MSPRCLHKSTEGGAGRREGYRGGGDGGGGVETKYAYIQLHCQSYCAKGLSHSAANPRNTSILNNEGLAKLGRRAGGTMHARSQITAEMFILLV